MLLSTASSLMLVMLTVVILAELIALFMHNEFKQYDAKRLQMKKEVERWKVVKKNK